MQNNIPFNKTDIRLIQNSHYKNEMEKSTENVHYHYNKVK